jgi:hypothetical protein
LKQTQDTIITAWTWRKNTSDKEESLWRQSVLINFTIQDHGGCQTATKPMRRPCPLAKAMTAELSVELAEATLYADDGAAEVVKEFQSGTLSLGVDNIGTAVAQTLPGRTSTTTACLSPHRRTAAIP